MSHSIPVRPSLVVAALLTLVAVACGGESSSPVEGSSADITATDPGADKVTECDGTEPFWRLNIDAKTLKFQNGSGSTRTVENPRPEGAAGFIEGAHALYRGKTKEDPNQSLTLVVTHAGAEGCSDESGDVFPYHASVVTAEGLFLGCCK